MAIKILHWAGILACITLIIACFLPWVYYGDIKETFNGFHSYLNYYGRPGKFLVSFSTIILVMMLLPKLWAKRLNLLLTALLLAYAIRIYVLFTSCYNAYCPEKLTAIYLVILMPVIMLVAAVLPQGKVVK